MLEIILPFVLTAAAVIVLLGILASGYVKAPPDRAFIISGLKKRAKDFNWTRRN